MSGTAESQYDSNPILVHRKRKAKCNGSSRRPSKHRVVLGYLEFQSSQSKAGPASGERSTDSGSETDSSSLTARTIYPADRCLSNADSTQSLPNQAYNVTSDPGVEQPGARLENTSHGVVSTSQIFDLSNLGFNVSLRRLDNSTVTTTKDDHPQSRKVQRRVAPTLVD